ncbi:type II toxin-antitoxin system prevent-host-death family antitoxin [Benzoatithermus flavus]|uniref:Antitoxin n=1 Tax=Benzoatithermus flavus TaxID=3108223 RepID=A0ABU8XWC2_9PROT
MGAPDAVDGPWKLENAQARFSEVVRRARTQGSQPVTVRGKNAVVVLAAEEFERLTAGRRCRPSLFEELRAFGLDAIPIERTRDTGRDIAWPERRLDCSIPTS